MQGLTYWVQTVSTADEDWRISALLSVPLTDKLILHRISFPFHLMKSRTFPPNWKKKLSHFRLKSWVNCETKIWPGIPSNWRIFESNWLSISSQFNSKHILQLLGIPGRILVLPVTQLFRSKWPPFFSLLKLKVMIRCLVQRGTPVSCPNLCMKGWKKRCHRINVLTFNPCLDMLYWNEIGDASDWER